MLHRSVRTRWLLVLVAAAGMGAAGSYQFVWSSLRPALGMRLGASEAALGTVYTVYLVAQTLSQFPAGWFRDRYGPRLPVAVGAVLLAVGYLGTGVATATWQVTLWYAVGGVGAGTLYTIAVNTPVKWFTERRGLATGIVTMAYGGLSVLFIPFVRDGLATDFFGTVATLGLVTGAIAFAGALVLRDPSPSSDDGDESEGDESPDAVSDQTATADETYTWREAARTWQFWLLYAMLVVVNAVGLMLIGKAVAFADQFGMPAAVLTAAASVVALADSAGLLAIGGLSDRLGRERTAAATVTLSGVAVALAVWTGATQRALPFVVLLGAAAFFRSPVFSIVPSLVGEYYGQARSSENYAILYTAKVWGGIGGGVVASLLITRVGWSTAFLLGAVALSAVGLSLTRLRPVASDSSHG
ncbi:MFS transporter, OFA family, oxalate/formate antiporter [Halomicrobium zhouii]|uniref:MFS transporter, OFA family, oxalate/formate antiporter n=1 Tax=Halomicrobium zhouii TaxID=767519 RepID=A0A1I6KIR3_9EURY|nr:OFA family MFS transporter [Halomicrobium zhouii]SFR90938.1 MFS transporter, OFA family, oxalate/formate antiporter [Halomicrobium zhouii]